MLKVLAIDSNRNFLDDLNTRLLLSDDNDSIQLVSTLTDTSNIARAVKSFSPEVIVVSANMIETQEDWDIEGVKVIGYAHNKEDVKTIQNYGLLNFGAVKNTTHLMSLLKGPLPTAPVKKKEEKPAADEIDTDGNISGFNTVVPQPVKTSAYDDYNTFLEYKVWEKNTHGSFSEFLEYKEWKAQMQPLEEQKKVPDDEPAVIQSGLHEEEITPIVPDEIVTEPEITNIPDTFDNEVETKSGSTNLSERIKEHKDDSRDEAVKRSVAQDILGEKRKTKVITVYAAKGGVGKTTIAKETAIYLALSAHGRGNYKVCIVDYNIDFGDVRSTLGFDENAIGMYEWAMEIKERIAGGEQPENISYTREEMNLYFQKLEKCGVFALLAPSNHIESMDIDRDELEVILRNTVENGGFDFVICDTGNNTRDSSVFAIEAADYILLVSTQDVTTAMCNSAAIKALSELDIDTSKIRLVVNNMMSTKNTGVSVQTIMDVFPYQCIATIKHNTDVIKSNNLGKPIVYQPNHPVTKELQKIIAFITGNEETELEKPKKGFFGSLFSKQKYE